MNPRSLYISYGILLAALGTIGFMLTHAKSALISGLASGGIMILISFFVANKIVFNIAKILNLVLIGVFGWRSTIAMNALMAGNNSKLVPATLLSLMALVSVAVLTISLLKAKTSPEEQA